MDSVKEEILKFLNNKGIQDIKVYFVYSKTDEANTKFKCGGNGKKTLGFVKR